MQCPSWSQSPGGARGERVGAEGAEGGGQRLTTVGEGSSRRQLLRRTLALAEVRSRPALAFEVARVVAVVVAADVAGFTARAARDRGEVTALEALETICAVTVMVAVALTLAEVVAHRGTAEVEQVHVVGRRLPAVVHVLDAKALAAGDAEVAVGDRGGAAALALKAAVARLAVPVVVAVAWGARGERGEGVGQWTNRAAAAATSGGATTAGVDSCCAVPWHWPRFVPLQPRLCRWSSLPLRVDEKAVASPSMVDPAPTRAYRLAETPTASVAPKSREVVFMMG